MAKYYFKYGAMGSSKTANLLMAAKNYDLQFKRVLVYKSSLDSRWGSDQIISRSGVENRDCLLIPDGNKVFEDVRVENEKDKVYCVLVDEVQFLDKEQIDALSSIVDILNIPVMCYGLMKTYKGTLFEGSKHLVELVDKLEEIKTTCAFCNKKATHNALFVNGRQVCDGDDVILGDTKVSEQFYLPVCRRHFKKPDIDKLKHFK